MVTRKDRLATDALREVRHTFNRFLSILVLAALAVAFLAGLRATAPDMEYTADNYFDRTHFMDGYVLSTLGLTEDDLTALAQANGVDQVEGAWSVDAIAVDAIVTVRSLPERLNLLELTEGRMPQAPDECVTEELLLVQLGLDVGDKVALDLDEDEGDEEDESALRRTEFTIVGIVSSPLYTGTDRGSSSLGGGSVDAYLYIPAENFTYDYYTAAYFTLDGLADLDCYGDEYDDRAEDMLDALEPLADERAQLRYDSVIGDAQTELDDAQAELDDAQAEADQELGDAKQELDDARRELDDGWAEYYDGLDTLDREVADARQELRDAAADLRQAEADYADGLAQYEDGLAQYEDGRAAYEDGLTQYQDGLAQYEDGLAQFEDGWAQYEDALAQYEDGEAQYQDGLTQYQAGLAQYEAGLDEYEGAMAQLDEQRDQLDAAWAQYWQALAPYEGTPYYDAVATQLAGQRAQLDAAQAQLDAGYEQLAPVGEQLAASLEQLNASKAVLDSTAEQLATAKVQLDDTLEQLTSARDELASSKVTLDETAATLEQSRAELDDAQAELERSKTELDDGAQAIADGWAEYYDGLNTLDEKEADGRAELSDALKELQDGEAEYADGLQEYEDGKAEADEELADARAKLADARAELDKVEECEWYVLGRNTNVGFVNYAQDAERVGNLANIFPIIFFLVAALACLTTMTRMVEDQRTQIGALKAMGFSQLSISKKYIGYALLASLLGGLIGLALGCTLIPAVIANAFNIMYDIPTLEFKNQAPMFTLSVLAAVVCTTGAALWACLSTLVDTPANLMRPRAPKAGKRVLLERVGPVWRRLSFTWKVTVRNLFRYKRRFWMTVLGIGGCTALIVTGFGLHDSIFSILDRQFDEISLYDATVGLDEKADSEAMDQITAYLDDSPAIQRWTLTSQTAMEASCGGLAHSGYLFAVDDLADFTQFIDLRHRQDDQPVRLPEDGLVITEKLSELLEVAPGDTLTLEVDDRRVDAVVSDIAENYVYHYAYLSYSYYAQLFGEQPNTNVALVVYDDQASQSVSDTVSAELMALDGVTSYSYIATIRDSFTDSMEAIDYAVVIVITAAAALAFVVLYNLTNINITERMRELATLKVLGFYDREVSAYVYRENIFLTIFGIALGLVLGRFLHAWMVLTVEVDLVMFGRTAPAYAYVLAAVLTAVFSVIVNVVAHFALKKVDMVESLKTVE